MGYSIKEENNKSYLVMNYPWGGEKLMDISNRTFYISQNFFIKVHLRECPNHIMDRVVDLKKLGGFSLLKHTYRLTEEEIDLVKQLEIEAAEVKQEYEAEQRKKWNEKERMRWLM